MSPKFIVRSLVAAFASLAAVCSAAAQGTYPTKPVNLIVVFAAGGPSDTLARQMTEQIGRQWNAQLIVENVAGAGGMIGTVRGARAAPDGYTILTQHQGHAAAQALYTGLKFDAQADFEPLGLINFGASVILSRKTLETKNMAELLAWMKAKGQDATIAHAGVGSNSFICASVLQHVTGLRLSMVPYRGTGPAMNDLVAGQIDLLCDQAVTSVPQIQAGTIKAYALTSSERLKDLDVPSNKEVGLPDLNSTTWNAAYAPKGTPKAVLDKWNDALQKFAADPAIVDRFAATGFAPFPPEMRSREAHAKYLADQMAFFTNLFTAMDVKKREVN